MNNLAMVPPTALIEAILLIETDGCGMARLKEVSSLSEKEIQSAIEQLQKDYTKEKCGIMLKEQHGKYILFPKTTLLPWLEDHYNSTKPQLSRPALEVLSIIAYGQPITRTEIEELRGTGCDAMMQKLLQHDLIQEKGKKKTIGNPMLYGTSPHFLQCFGLDTLKALPQLPGREKEKFQP